MARTITLTEAEARYLWRLLSIRQRLSTDAREMSQVESIAQKVDTAPESPEA